MKELGLIYLCGACAAFVVSLAVYCYKKHNKKIMDGGSAQIDLRDKKNKEITEGISMLVSVYCKANEVKVSDNLLGRLPLNKRRVFDIVKNRNKFLKDGEESVWDEILQSTSEEFRGYVSGNKSLYDILRLNKEGKKNSVLRKRLSRKIVPIDEKTDDLSGNGSLVTPFLKIDENHQEAYVMKSPRHQKRPSFVQRLSNMIPSGVFREVDVPVSVRIKVKEYLENRHIKVKSRESSWFKKATSKEIASYLKYNIIRAWINLSLNITIRGNKHGEIQNKNNIIFQKI
jgi:hypothetical protein